MYFIFSEFYLMRYCIYCNIFYSYYLSFLSHSSASECFKSRDKFVIIKWFHHIIICSYIESFYFLVCQTARSKYEYWGTISLFSQYFTNISPISLFAPKTKVKYYHVRLILYNFQHRTLIGRVSFCFISLYI